MKITSIRIQADDGTMGSVIKYGSLDYVTVQWDEPKEWQYPDTDRLTEESMNDLLFQTHMEINLTEIGVSND